MNRNTIELNGLDKSFQHVHALCSVSASAGAGDIIGLVGRNGAGKTTLLETLAGLQLPDAGSVKLLGADSAELNDEVRARLGMVFQDDELYGWMTVRRHIALVAAFYPRWNQHRVNDLLERWQVPPDRKVGSLSRGQRQMLAIALALGPDPEVLLLDEPASALDPVARRDFLAELVDLACESARTIVFSTHLVGDLERIANRIWLMSRGHLVIDGETDQLRENTRRIVLRSDRALPPTLGLPGSLREDIEGGSARVIVNSPDSLDARSLEQQFGARVEIQHLGLEELCLEYLS